jgi:hypothetical protein
VETNIRLSIGSHIFANTFVRLAFLIAFLNETKNDDYKNEGELRTVGSEIRGYQPAGGAIYQIPAGGEMITRR